MFFIHLCVIWLLFIKDRIKKFILCCSTTLKIRKTVKFNCDRKSLALNLYLMHLISTELDSFHALTKRNVSYLFYVYFIFFKYIFIIFFLSFLKQYSVKSFCFIFTMAYIVHASEVRKNLGEMKRYAKKDNSFE